MYRGSGLIADFSIYKYPNKLFLECKSVQGGTLPRANISDNQLYGMYKEHKKRGVNAGIIVWYVKYDKTIYIPIREIYRVLEKEKQKSIKYRDINNLKHYEVPARKKQIMFTYDLIDLMEQATKLKGE